MLGCLRKISSALGGEQELIWRPVSWRRLLGAQGTAPRLLLVDAPHLLGRSLESGELAVGVKHIELAVVLAEGRAGVRAAGVVGRVSRALAFAHNQGFENAQQTVAVVGEVLKDIVFGTSTGAIIAALIALGHRVDEIHALYKEHVPRIMQRKKPRENSRVLAEPAKEVFGDNKFDSVKTGVGCFKTQKSRLTNEPVVT
jgi:hypothetical protein